MSFDRSVLKFILQTVSLVDMTENLKKPMITKVRLLYGKSSFVKP